ncbi:MAG: SDR family NAD(P)-dependent oxidoreductase [Chloroflexi bacterium]|nr:MAG: SDR family NAD(P)-dependent oxidoreductase [Chloroflexota bacterium]
MDLAARTILVTGGTSGTGLAVAKAAHRLGADVLLGSRSQTSYAEAVAPIGDDRVAPFIADFADPRTAALRRTEPGPMREAAIARHRDELDRLVHENAASAFVVNHEGPRWLFERLVPMLRDGGRIIVYSSL